MFYKNFVTRFILRKNFTKRVKMRIKQTIRKVTRNEFDDIYDLFVALDAEPKHIFDCGANVGYVTNAFIQKFPNATIHTFEPNLFVFEKMKAYFAQNPNVIAHNKGVGRELGKLVFNINKNSGTSSFLSPNDYHKHNFALEVEQKEVEVVSIGDYIRENGIDKIDVLKLDIEGFELEVLKGIPFIDQKVNLIYTEVNLIPTYDGQPLMDEIISYLRQHNFHILNFYGINENQYHQAVITNIVFISNSFKNALKQKVGDKYFGY